jgi:hypothetical protein
MSAGRPRLDIDATRERLLALGCVHAAEQLGPLLGEAVREEVPAHAFLDRLLAAELSGREERRVKTSLRLSNLPTGQTLEGLPRDWGSGCGGHWRERVLGGVETLPEVVAERAVVDGAADLEQPVGAAP